MSSKWFMSWRIRANADKRDCQEEQKLNRLLSKERENILGLYTRKNLFSKNMDFFLPFLRLHVYTAVIWKMKLNKWGSNYKISLGEKNRLFVTKICYFVFINCEVNSKPPKCSTKAPGWMFNSPNHVVFQALDTSREFEWKRHYNSRHNSEH